MEHKHTCVRYPAVFLVLGIKLMNKEDVDDEFDNATARAVAANISEYMQRPPHPSNIMHHAAQHVAQTAAQHVAQTAAQHVAQTAAQHVAQHDFAAPQVRLVHRRQPAYNDVVMLHENNVRRRRNDDGMVVLHEDGLRRRDDEGIVLVREQRDDAESNILSRLSGIMDGGDEITTLAIAVAMLLALVLLVQSSTNMYMMRRLGGM